MALGSTPAEKRIVRVTDHVTALEIKKHLYSSFSNVAALMGYSEVHGRIIAALTANARPMSLAELAKETGYSASSISTSLDLLEVLAMITKVKKTGDRKLYVRLDGDLLEGLKRAIVAKGRKSLGSALNEFRQYEEAIQSLPRDDPERAKVENILHTLRGELEVLTQYLELLGEIQLPKDR
ncbi:MAG TPA: MarR family transcriptional regulator [Candidatus Thermoplasmatota archaeon]|nr:MarR family transcriptional regulator [Candidatus Thermoplasmatota archaeon]